METEKKKRLALVGCGKLGRLFAEAYCMGLLPDYELAGALSRRPERARELAGIAGCKACKTLDELLDLKPDYVVEMASVAAVKEMAETVLSRGADLIVLSIGAFADGAFYRQVRETAARSHTRVHIASGAVGGFDVLRTVTLMGEVGRRLDKSLEGSGTEEAPVRASMETRKTPCSLKGSPLYREAMETEEMEAFRGSTKDAIAMLPTHVNVSVAASLATSGTDHLKYRIVSVPDMTGDDHRITAEIDGVKAVVDVYSASGDIAAWSVVALLQNLASPIVF